MSAPEFPGVSDADTPVFDEIVRDWPLTMTSEEAAALAAEPIEPWGLDEIAPLPVVALIGELTARVGAGAAWAIEQEVVADAYHRRALNLGEEGSDEHDTGSAGDADLADGPGGPTVVGAEGGGVPDDPGSR